MRMFICSASQHQLFFGQALVLHQQEYRAELHKYKSTKIKQFSRRRRSNFFLTKPRYCINRQQVKTVKSGEKAMIVAEESGGTGESGGSGVARGGVNFCSQAQLLHQQGRAQTAFLKLLSCFMQHSPFPQVIHLCFDKERGNLSISASKTAY